MRVFADTSDLQRLAAMMVQGVAEVPAGTRDALERAGVFTAEHARSIAPVDTGELRGSIRHQTAQWSVRVWSPTRQSVFQEIGTSRHPAQPTFIPAAEQGETVLGEELQRVGTLW